MRESIKLEVVDVNRVDGDLATINLQFVTDDADGALGFMHEIEDMSDDAESYTNAVMGYVSGARICCIPRATKLIQSDAYTIVLCGNRKYKAKCGEDDEYDRMMGVLVCAFKAVTKNHIGIEAYEPLLKALSKLDERELLSFAQVLMSRVGEPTCKNTFARGRYKPLMWLDDKSQEILAATLVMAHDILGMSDAVSAS